MVLPRKTRTRSWSPAEALDGLFFLAGAGLALWLAWLLVDKDLGWGWRVVVAVVVFWLLTAYIGLPRLQQVLTKIYVPDYFIGRTLTSTGILGDPVNLAVRGEADRLHTAMTRAGWTRADPVTARSSWGLVVSAVFRRPYAAAPVSPLLLFGRPEAFAYEQEVGGNASQRHHVRFWPTPPAWPLPGGYRADWLAAATFDRAVGLSLFTLQVTHKVDADIDVERDHVVATVHDAVPEARTERLEDFVTAFHARNGGGDLVHTDGDMLVLDVTAVPAQPSSQAPDQTAPAATSRRLPPVSLLLAGGVSILRTVVGLVAVGAVAAPSVVALVLWVATLYRQAWARLLVMAVCTVEAVGQLLALSAGSGSPSLSHLMYAGLSTLVVVAVSGDEARHWVRGPVAPAPDQGVRRVG